MDMARKNKGLPFIVQPRLKPIKEILGTDKSGKIEIERIGYLTVSEKAIVQGATRGDESLATTMRIAAKIAQEENVDPRDIFTDITKNPRPAYLERHQAELEEMFEMMVMQEERIKVVAVTALILTRVTPDWDATQTAGLHPDLLDDIYDLYQDEERKSMEALESAVENLEGVEKTGTEGND